MVGPEGWAVLLARRGLPPPSITNAEAGHQSGWRRQVELFGGEVRGRRAKDGLSGGEGRWERGGKMYDMGKSCTTTGGRPRVCRPSESSSPAPGRPSTSHPHPTSPQGGGKHSGLYPPPSFSRTWGVASWWAGVVHIKEEGRKGGREGGGTREGRGRRETASNTPL